MSKNKNKNAGGSTALKEAPQKPASDNVSEDRPKKTRTRKDNYVIVFIMLAVSLIVELLIANHSAVGMIFAGGETKDLPIGTPEMSNYTIVSKNEPAYFRDVDTEMKNIMLTLYGSRFEYVDVTVSFNDDNFRLDDAFGYNKAAVQMRTGENCRNFVDLSSYGKVDTIKISCDETIKITEAKVNTVPDFRFSIIRFLSVFAAMICIYFGLWKRMLSDDGLKCVKTCAAVLSVFVLFSVSIISSLSGEALLMTMPDNVTKQDQYTQLFDAFLDGRTDLAIDYDTSKLEAVSDPYDRSERNANDLHGKFWDRAYYNGKYYSYFGAAPIFTVYYPVWILTKKVPSALFASAILCVHAIVFISLLYGLFLKKFCKERPAVLVILGQVALIFGSSMLAITSEAQFYFIAVISGAACTAAFLYFLFKAYYTTEFVPRLVLLALAGIACALTAASRPTMLLYCFIGIIPALDIMTGSKDSVKQKISYAAAIGVPIFIGAALIMAYNNARFENPFEFGFNYQLTVSKAKANTIKLSLIPATLYHYFFQQPSFNSSFPYIGIAKNEMGSYTRFNYAGRTMGIFSYPLTWGAFLLPFAPKTDDKIKHRVLYALPCAVVLMAFIDMCKAGAHYRYTADILFPALLFALIVIFDVLANIRKRSDREYKAAYAFTAAAMVITIIIGILLIFANEGNTMLGDYANAAEFFRKL